MLPIMNSLRRNSKPGESVEVHDEDVVEELMIDADDHIRSMFVSKAEALHKQHSRRPQSTPHTIHSRASTVDTNTLLNHSLKIQDWLNDKKVKDVQEKADLEAKKTRNMYMSLLGTEDSFIQEVGDSIAYQELLRHRKKEMLHKKWTERVFQPLERQIGAEMSSVGFSELDRRKRRLYKDYLEYVNEKGHVFLDTFAPEEYFAQTLHPTRPSLLVAQTKRLRDPLISQAVERTNEDRTIFRCITGTRLRDKDVEAIKLPPLPLVPLGRHGTRCKTWLAMPMGDIESPVRIASRRRMHGDSNATHFDFEAWSKMPFSSKIIDEEMKSQKKRTYLIEPPFGNSAQTKQELIIGSQIHDQKQPENTLMQTC